MMVQFSGASGKIYSIVMNDLFGTIVPEQSHVKVCLYNSLVPRLLGEGEEAWEYIAPSKVIHNQTSNINILLT